MPVINYVWDADNDAYLMETDDIHATSAVYTNEPEQFGQLISQRRQSTSSYYHFDAIGSTRELTDTAENVTDTNLFDAWGTSLTSTGMTEYSFRYVGQHGYYSDASSNSIYVRARNYCPDASRWLSRDPLGPFVGMNLYHYSQNRPVQLIDPSGLLPGCVIPGVTIKQKDILWKYVFNQSLPVPAGADPWGHWWTEVDTSSYGWWPKYRPVDTPVKGVEGQLNGMYEKGTAIKAGKWDATHDQHGGDPKGNSYKARLSGIGLLLYGKGKGRLCCLLSCKKAKDVGDIKDCLHKAAKAFADKHDKWAFPAVMLTKRHNCHSFQNWLLKRCCIIRPALLVKLIKKYIVDPVTFPK